MFHIMAFICFSLIAACKYLEPQICADVVVSVNWDLYAHLICSFKVSLLKFSHLFQQIPEGR